MNNELDVSKLVEMSPLGAEFATSTHPATQFLAIELAKIWYEFEQRLNNVPFVKALYDGTITLSMYRRYLFNLRQQVIDGGPWLARTASHMPIELFELRSKLIQHAATEQNDYKMLEQDYVNVGGTLDDLASGEKNIGSYALSSFIFHQTSIAPLSLLGAIFIFEGLGSNKAQSWASLLQKHLSLNDNQVSFLAYHGINDDNHYEQLRKLLQHPAITQNIARQIVKTAKVVSCLYSLQLQEIDNF